MTSDEKWTWVCEKIKNLEAEVTALKKLSEMRIKNKQGQGAHSDYKGIPEDDGMTVEQIEARYKI